MKPRILLVNPPIYDFAAYDFWLKPYGLLSVAGFVQHRARLRLFDYMDRLHPFMAARKNLRTARYNRGTYYSQKIDRPKPLKDIPRYYRRFGIDRSYFRRMLQAEAAFDFVLVQTVMTWWYPGVAEVIEDIRQIQPAAKIVLGGNYATLCKTHAQSLGADMVVAGANPEPLWQYLGIEPDPGSCAYWQGYDQIKSGVIKLSDGCPFSCTYCSVPGVYGRFTARPASRAIDEIKLLADMGAADVAFYDDALLYKADDVLVPFLEQIIRADLNINLHCPNALNARFLTDELASLMVRAGFKTFYLGFESVCDRWQNQTGAKVFSEELARAVDCLRRAGAPGSDITAYQILGHPDADNQRLEESMRFVHSLGIRGMLADFSPVPGTVDGDRCAKVVDMSEPLNHNKTAFTIVSMGFDQSNYFKDMQRQLNKTITKPA